MMNDLDDAVELLQEELNDTKSALSALEEQHELLENAFEVYKEEMKNDMNEMRKNMQDLYRSMEKLYYEISPDGRGAQIPTPIPVRWKIP